MHLSRKGAARLLALSTFGFPERSHSFEALQVRFCADVSRDSCLQLELALQNAVTQRSSIMARLKQGIEADVELPPLPIGVHVSSNGGSLLSALHMYDVMRGIPNLHTHVEGLVASAATLFTVSGSHRTMTKHSMMLVHQPSTNVHETLKFTDVRDEMINLQKCTRALVDIYREATTMEPDVIIALLQNEQYLTAPECLELGLVDEIV